MSKEKKTITIAIPCWNEEKNIRELVVSIEEQFQKHLQNYDYVIQFSDNCSTDDTRKILKDLCEKNTHVRAIFNVSNVSGSAIHNILQAKGDCCIHMACDFQDPPGLIPQLVHEWENGAKIVCAIKESSDEKKSMWKVRSLYYKLISKFSSIPQIEHFTGFGLYDRGFIEIIRRVEDPLVTLRGLVAEYGHGVSKIYFKQPVRKHGKSKNNFLKNYDYAMRNFTTYSKTGIHVITLAGVLLAIFSLICIVILCVLNIIFDKVFFAPIIILCILFLYSTLLIILGVIGTYILNINIRMLKRPLAIEAERLGVWELDPLPENGNPYEPFYPTDVDRRKKIENSPVVNNKIDTCSEDANCEGIREKHIADDIKNI